jgi:tagatose 6-phosphate kinase
MILTVTPNIALDRTYVVGRVEIGAVHKVRTVYAQTGGKGVNVSRTIGCLGGKTLVAGLVGGAGLDEGARELRAAGLECDLYAVQGSPRQTTVVVAEEDGTATAFDEPGPTVTEDEWKGFENHLCGLLGQTRCVVVAGSLPPGAPEEALAHVVASAHERDVAAIVDARGGPLRAALGEAPLVAKLNRSELSQTVGRPCDSDRDVVEGARELQELGARKVIVTLGADGAIALDGRDVWRVTHSAQTGNPIGAGDAFTAGVAVTLADARPFREALGEGAAAALASLRSPAAGRIELSDLRAARPRVTTHDLAAGPAQPQ